MNAHGVETEVLVRVCDEVGDQYRFGFNGQEKVNEISGMGNHNTAEFWEYDTRLGRRWNLDPVDQISVSNYAVFANNPIVLTDVDGDCPTCETEYPDAEVGDIVQLEGGKMDWTKQEDGSWIGWGGELNEMTIVADREGGDLQQQNGGMSDWSGPSGRANWGLAAAALGLEHTPGSFRLGTSKLGFSPKYYGNAWRGNQYAKTFNIGKIGRGLGYFGAGVGTAIDIYGVGNYYKYGKDSPNAVHPGKAGLNTTMSAYGIFISGPGAALYFGIDVFHPGGWPGFFENYGNMGLQLQSVYGPNFRLVPFGPK